MEHLTHFFKSKGRKAVEKAYQVAEPQGEGNKSTNPLKKRNAEETRGKAPELNSSETKTDRFADFFKSLKADEKLPEEITEGPEVIILVVGETGSGKSRLINKIIGRDEVVIGHELESMTKTITAVTSTHQKKKIIFFDTPGFDDTYLPDAKVFQMIASFLRDLYERQVYVNGILYCHPIDNRRVTGSSRRQLEFMERLIGQKSLKNVIFVLTFADRMDYNRDLMDSRIGELKRTYWAPFLAKDARMFIKDGDGPPRALVDMVLRSQKTILDLQRELVDERRTLLRTSAGGTIKTESENKISYLEQELEALRKEIKDPATRKDPELVQEIRKL